MPDRIEALPFLQPSDGAKLRLFCLPFAGGSASVYHDWKQKLPETVELAAVQYPGRETRPDAPLIDDMDQMTECLVAELEPWLDKPFAIYGHSMGARIGFELVHGLGDRGLPLPQHLFVGACDAPRRAASPRQGPMLHELSDDELLDRVGRIGGLLPDHLENREFVDLLLPVYRSDFRLNERYRRRDTAPLAVPITAFGGTWDSYVELEALEDWGEETVAPFNLFLVEGDHFFLRGAADRVVDLLLSELNQDPG